jgi:hypothetical protein
MTEITCPLPQFLIKNSRIVLCLGHYRILPNSFPFIIFRHPTTHDYIVSILKESLSNPQVHTHIDSIRCFEANVSRAIWPRAERTHDKHSVWSAQTLSARVMMITTDRNRIRFLLRLKSFVSFPPPLVLLFLPLLALFILILLHPVILLHILLFFPFLLLHFLVTSPSSSCFFFLCNFSTSRIPFFSFVGLFLYFILTLQLCRCFPPNSMLFSRSLPSFTSSPFCNFLHLRPVLLIPSFSPLSPTLSASYSFLYSSSVIPDSGHCLLSLGGLLIPH